MPADGKVTLGAVAFFVFLVGASVIGSLASAVAIDQYRAYRLEKVTSKPPVLPAVQPSGCACRKTGLVLPSGALLPEVSR